MVRRNSSGALALVMGAVVVALPVLTTTQVVAPPPAAAAADPCGEPVPRPGGGHYTCTFVDEFDGPTLNPAVWHVQEGETNALSCSVDSPRTVRLEGGLLHLTARPADATLQCPPRADGSRAPYVGSGVNTYWKWSQQYGRFEARMRSQVASGPGAHEAFWLWPDVRHHSTYSWPASGEIDISETYAAHPDLSIPFLHYSWNDNGGPKPGLNTAWDCVAERGQWHTYLLEWTATKLVISVDGTECLTNTKGARSFRKRFIMAFSQMVDVAGANRILGPEVLPTTLEVDHVKVWQ